MIQKSKRTVRYTAEELDEMLARGEDQTDWERVRALTHEEIEASIDFEEEGVSDWATAQKGLPRPGEFVSLYIDADILAWFKAQGYVGYKARMNDALRAYIEDEMRKDEESWTEPDRLALQRSKEEAAEASSQS